GTLDEALGLAIGLRAVGPGVAMLEAELGADPVEVPGAEGRAVVGEHGLDAHAEAAVVGHGIAQELHGAAGSLVGIHVAEADPGMVIDGHEQELPAGAPDCIAAVAGDPVTGSLDAPKLLGVQVKQVTGSIVLV